MSILESNDEYAPVRPYPPAVERAWAYYCRTANGVGSAADYWTQLPADVQAACLRATS